jgi:hypothetical protein
MLVHGWISTMITASQEFPQATQGMKVMSTAVLTGSYVNVPGFPAGSVVANVVASITGAATPIVSQTVPPGTAMITFSSVPPDTYTFSVAGVDASNNVFGTASTGTFTVSAPTTVTLSLPSGFVATVS